MFLVGRGCPSLVEGGGLKTRWRRLAWVQIPPPASCGFSGLVGWLGGEGCF
jgi:hypothetical protein